MFSESILKLFDLANRVDKYSEDANALINDSYQKRIIIGNGTINISVKYENVPSRYYAKSLNLVNDCFSDFYKEFSEKVLNQ